MEWDSDDEYEGGERENENDDNDLVKTIKDKNLVFQFKSDFLDDFNLSKRYRGMVERAAADTYQRLIYHPKSNDGHDFF